MRPRSTMTAAPLVANSRLGRLVDAQLRRPRNSRTRWFRRAKRRAKASNGDCQYIAKVHSPGNPPSCARICGHGLLFLKHGVGQALRQCQSGRDHTLVQVSNIDDYRQQKALQPARSPVERLLADARQRLIETGTRNRLVHNPRGGKRTRSLPIVDVDADGLFATLVRSNRMMRFLPADRTREPALEEPNSNVMRYPAPNAVPTVLNTTLHEEKLEKRLLAIYRDAKTAEEEQGINILFLAIGFLRWYEDDKSEVLREAPLVLVPVSLTRDLRRSTFDLRCRDDDLTTNQAIQERLRADFGVVLPELPESEEWVPTEYFATVTETIATKSRWSIDPTGVELGAHSENVIRRAASLSSSSGTPPGFFSRRWNGVSTCSHLGGGLRRQRRVPVAYDRHADGNFAYGRIARLQGSPREGPESAPKR